MTIEVKNTYSSTGFSLIELLIVMTIFSILATFTLSTFSAFTNKSRTQVVTRAFIGAAHLAKQTAFTGTQTVMCASNDSQTNCSNENSWENGWIVYLDSNNDDDLGSSEQIIHRHQGLSKKFKVAANSDFSQIVFFKNGLTSLDSMQPLVLCNNRKALSALSIATSGLSFPVDVNQNQKNICNNLD